MNKRKIFLIITAVILISILSSSLTAITVLAWPFSDVNSSDWFYNDVLWLDNNGITHGCDASHYCPNSNVTRAEMAAFLHREAGVQVVAGFHVQRSGSDVYVSDYFNNINGAAPSKSGSNGFYDFDMGFTTEGRFVMCAVDTNYPETHDALCTINTFDNVVRVRIYDISVGGLARAEFWVMVYGQ
jgi:hypothetical protein